jgi:hypothetical protein
MTPTLLPAETPRRGAGLLLEHVLALEEAVRPHARARLEAQLGRELSTLLVCALTSRRKRREA